MTETALLANAPADPFTLLAESIGDLLLEANNYLDGQEIENEEQEQAVASILTRLRRETKAAEDQRKAEKKPHDDAAKEVQAKWTPLIGKAELAVSVAKNALAVFLGKKEKAQRAEAEAALEDARKLAEAAALESALTSRADLAGQTVVEALREDAIAAQKAAERLAKAPVQAKGGERAVGLRSVFTPLLIDPVAALKHYRAVEPQALKDWLMDQAGKDVRSGQRTIPGFIVQEARVAQ